MHKPLNKIPIDQDNTYNEIKSDTIDYMELSLEFWRKDTATKHCAMVVRLLL